MKNLIMVYTKLRSFFDPSLEGNPFKAYEKRKTYITFGARYKRTTIIGG